MRRQSIVVVTASILAASQVAVAQHKHGGGGAAAPKCDTTELACATFATPTFARDGALWLVWAAGGRVSIARSSDLGKTFSGAVVLPAPKLKLDNGPDARPKIVALADGALVVTFATRDDKYNGQAFITRSDDGGKTFSEPRRIAASSPSQRFETPAVAPDGHVFVAWIDKRNGAAAKAKGKPYAGAALAFAWDDGKPGSAGEGVIALDNTCECCRIGIGFAAADRPVILFRNIFPGGVRDHAILTFAGRNQPGAPVRISDDDAQMDGCPHHGPSLSIAADGTFHAAWVALGKKRKGAYTARSTDGGATFSEPTRLGDEARQIERPYVLAEGDSVAAVYKAFDGERTVVEARVSHDGGKTFEAARAIAETKGDSDHPLLVAQGGRIFLSWMTRNEGYRLMALEAAS